MVLHLEILRQFINRNSIKEKEHLIWNKSVEQSVKIVKLAKEVGLSKNQYRPNELFWIIENQNEMTPNTKLEKTCETKDCIVHYNVIQYNLDFVVEMDVDTYVQACERFDKHCDPKDSETGCINWNGYINNSGYGAFGFLAKPYLAHRVAYILANCEDIPKGQVVRHLCPNKNKLCVNPDHLCVGTPQQNSQDELDGGFIPLGENHPRAIISNEMAQMIIDSFGKKKTTKERAKEFGVSGDIIQSIDRAEAWRSLMTATQIVERENVVRRKQTMEVLSEDLILKIKNSSESQEKCAKTYNTTKAIVQSIREGRYKSISERDEIGFKKAIDKLAENSTKFKDDFGIEHFLFKNDQSQDPNAKRYKITYFGITIPVHRASYMGHSKIKSTPKGQMVRHKCLYKHCISHKCLELGTAQDNVNDMKRDNTTKKGVKSHFAKITEELATQIKQTKGIGTIKQRSDFFNVSIAIITQIDSHQSWKHLADVEIDQEVIDKLEGFVTNQPKIKRVRLV
jgi:hypothetical protein